MSSANVILAGVSANAYYDKLSTLVLQDAEQYGGGYHVIITAFTEEALYDCARVLSQYSVAIVVASIAENFPFKDALKERAAEIIKKPIIALPVLCSDEDVNNAMLLIINAAMPIRDSIAKEASEKNRILTPIERYSLETLKKAAAAFKNHQTEKALHLIKTISPPTPAATALKMQILISNNEDKPNYIQVIKNALNKMTEEEKNITGAPAFLSVLVARKSMADIL